MVKNVEKKKNDSRKAKKANGTGKEVINGASGVITNGTTASVIRFPGETDQERRNRRKMERRKRTTAKRIHSGRLPLTSLYSAKLFDKNWDEDTAFIANVFQYIPESKQPHLLATQQEQLQEYLLDDDDEETEKAKREKFLSRTLGVNGLSEVTRAATHDELKERLKRKMEELAQKRNEKKLKQKLRKIAMSQDGEDKKSKKVKAFISQSNPNLGKAIQSDKSGRKPDIDAMGSPSQTLGRTPLRKRPVVKSDGQVVYSKFDFISEDKHDQSIDLKARKGKAKPTDLLKMAENYEGKITRLATQGKKDEAVSAAESRKWGTALKRAEGEKIRDDPFLLKKTIKKQDKLKQASRKKWQERTENVNQQKKQREDKRNSNIQARKDEKKKRSLKLQRKKGRIV